MAVRSELASQILVVVQLAVLNCPDRAVLVADGLVPACHVDDAEPTGAERDAVRGVRAAVARAAMDHRVRHRVEHVRGDDGPLSSGDLDDAADTTHRSEPPSERLAAPRRQVAEPLQVAKVRAGCAIAPTGLAPSRSSTIPPQHPQGGCIAVAEGTKGHAHRQIPDPVVHVVRQPAFGAPEDPALPIPGDRRGGGDGTEDRGGSLSSSL